MKITIETPGPGEEDEIIIRCTTVDEKMLRLITALKAGQEKLTGYQDDKIVKLVPGNIFYFEAVDNKVFAYTGNGVFEIRKKLYELEEEYSHGDFMRISKSTILNITKIAYIKPIFNGRFEALLKNEEKVVISRQYVIELKNKLGI